MKNEMSREEILKKSREEHEGGHDEREEFIFGVASRVGMITGASLCGLLMLMSIFLRRWELGAVAILVFEGMRSSENIVCYKKLRQRRYLIRAIVEAIVLAANAIILAVKVV